ncbi:ATPase, T2SS/T4P/T4SS family [Hungatella effluvii]|uniref:ATPase, T2SS/T4P/T4SS family n=1 Tax=Hungatella effluvii TaxID=1096246 RepID=UPI0022E00C9A|nr:ATPase, T2SS/T4P/T4SS family [Hungatella effluvii]
MLGEKRSRAAFHGNSVQSVPKEKVLGMSHEPELMVCYESASGKPDKLVNFQFGSDYPVEDGNWTRQKKKNVSDVLEPAVETEISMEEEQPSYEAENYTKQHRGGRTLRTHDLFFSAEKERQDFASVLREVQAYLSKEYSCLVTGDGSEEVKAQIRRFAGKYILDHRIAVEGMTTDELIDGIYSEMAEFGFLTKYIHGEGIEEIDVNAWDDVEVQYSGGVTKKLTEHFDSPEHAINVVRRMLHVSGMVLDDASPSVLGHLSKNIRIAVLKSPIVDEDVGVAASIRIVNPQSMKKDDFVNGGTATGQMLDFLSECIRYGISVCVAGATSSGKTTLLGWLLTTIPDGKRIYSIENGSRELALVRRDELGRVKNSVIHTLTRDSENERQRVDQIALLDMALRFNPDVIVVGEMRGPEANAAQEAARTGVAVVTTIHSMSCDATYRRMVSLCKRAVDMNDDTLMGFVTEAYPIVAFCKQLENKDRRLMEIMECEILPDGTRNFRPLFQYQITENKVEGGRFIITGQHRQVNPISESLARRLMENGMPQEMLMQLCRKSDDGKEEKTA